MSKPKNPIELVDRYLQAVRFWLPKSRRQEELLAELGEDLCSQIEAKEEETGRPLENAEVSAILKTCGSPMTVASRLGPQRHLIGPALYPIYTFVLKMVLLWIMVPVFTFIVGPVNLTNTAGDWGRAVVHTLGDLWNGAFIAAGIITLVFAVIERTHALAGVECKWDPETLPPLQKPEGRTSFVQTVCELAFGIFGFIWLLLIPSNPFLILGPAAHMLKPAPLWHAFYLLILLLAALGLARSAITLAKPQWRWFPHASQLLQLVCTLILLRFLLAATFHVPAGDWYPFVTLADSAVKSATSVRLAAIVNVSILISLASTWLGVSIALVVHTLKFLRFLRGSRDLTTHSVSLQVR
jgi:hypothetical protein